jgi:hypothetical protein
VGRGVRRSGDGLARGGRKIGVKHAPVAISPVNNPPKWLVSNVVRRMARETGCLVFAKLFCKVPKIRFSGSAALCFYRSSVEGLSLSISGKSGHFFSRTGFLTP